MSAYNLRPPATLPSLAVQEAKEKRRKLLEAARQTRRANYLRFSKKMRLQTSNDLL